MEKKSWNRRENVLLGIGIAVSIVYMASMTYVIGKANIKDLDSQAKDTSLAKYSVLKAETDGDNAVVLRDEMVKVLASRGLGLDSIHIDHAELDHQVKNVYCQQAIRAMTSLEALKGNPELAEKFRKEFFQCRKLLGTAHQIQADEYIHRLVAINYLGKAGLQGVKIDVADLKKAGIIVPAVYHDKPLKNRKSINKAIADFNERYRNR